LKREEDAAVLEAVRQIASNPEESVDPLKEVCDMLEKGCAHYDWVGIYEVNGDMLILKAFTGPSETEHTSIRVGDGICGSAAKTGRTELIGDVGEDSRYIACFPSTRSEIVVPIKIDENVLGEIDIDSDKSNSFSEADKEFLEEVAISISGLLRKEDSID